MGTGHATARREPALPRTHLRMLTELRMEI
jgi:hypothetical protein